MDRSKPEPLSLVGALANGCPKTGGGGGGGGGAAEGSGDTADTDLWRTITSDAQTPLKPTAPDGGLEADASHPHDGGGPPPRRAHSSSPTTAAAVPVGGGGDGFDGTFVPALLNGVPAPPHNRAPPLRGGGGGGGKDGGGGGGCGTGARVAEGQACAPKWAKAKN